MKHIGSSVANRGLDWPGDHILLRPSEYGTPVAVTPGSRRSGSCRASFGLAAFVVAASLCARARADELRLTLDYSAPSGCPSAEAMQSAVRRLATKQTEPYSARVAIESEQQRFTARINASDGTERTLVGNTCEEVAEATAVVLALAISPSSPLGETAPAPTPAKDAEHRKQHPPLASAGPPGEPVHLKLGAAGVLDLGTLPHVDLGASARVGVTARTWSAALEGAYWLLPERRVLPQNSNLYGDFSWWALIATGCVAPLDGSPRIELCAGPELGRLTGRGGGVTSPATSTKDAGTYRLGIQALAEVHVPLSTHLRLRAGLGAAAVVLGRRAFEIDHLGLYSPPVVSGRAAFGVEFIF